MRFLLLSSFFAFSVCSAALADQDIENQIFGTEVGVHALGGSIRTIRDDSTNTPSFAVGGNVRANMLLAHLNGDVSYLNLDGKKGVEITGDGDVLLFFKLHEALARANLDGSEADLEALRLMGGIGADKNFDLPNEFGNIAVGISLGGIYMNWKSADPTQTEMKKLIGAYIGTKIGVRVLKLKNELSVAYYVAPKEINTEEVSPNFEPENLDQGVIASGRHKYELLSVDFADLGPELRWQLSQLPDGTEYRAMIGISGHIGVGIGKKKKKKPVAEPAPALKTAAPAPKKAR